MMDLSQIKSKIIENEKKREELFKRQKALNMLLTKNYKTIQKLKEKVVDEEVKTRSEDLSWLLQPDVKPPLNLLSARNAWAKKYDISFSGYFVNTLQPVPVISLHYKQDISKIQEGIELMLPHYKPVKGSFHVDITDNALSEFGIFTLIVSFAPGNIAKIVRTVYSRDEDLFVGTLNEALTEVAKKYYYEKDS
jgi:hypothetical protein